MFKQPVRDENFLDAAEDLDGPFVSALQDLARQHRITVISGMAERIADEPRAYNTVVVIGRPMASGWRPIASFTCTTPSAGPSRPTSGLATSTSR